eukprot:Opistho-2@50932
MAPPAAATKRGNGIIANGYLFLYNIAQTAGWSYILYLVGKHLSENNFDHVGLYAKVEWPLKVFQSAAALEVLHCIIGIVKSPVNVTFTQVLSRVALVWLIAHSVPETQDNIAFLLMTLAWTITEIIRYMYYALNIVDAVPYVLVWLRYTLFYILYPLGVTGEMLMIYSAIPHAAASKIYSPQMPNTWNISWNFHQLLYVMLLIYLPGFPPMYMHMIRQRKKIIGGGDKAKTH